MKFAWIQAEVIRDTTPTDPFNWHHPEVAKFYDTEVPDKAENGDSWVNGKLVKRPIPEPIVAQPQEKQLWNDYDFRNGLTLAEKVKWDNDSAPEVVTVKAELPKDKAGAQELVDFLVSAQVISQASADNILA